MRGFFAELKRRHVYRIAVYYAAAAWLLVQIADVIVENFNIPDRYMQLLIVCAVLGFPLALVFTWLYDISPSGIRRTSARSKSEEKKIPSEIDVDVATPKADERPGLVVLPFDSFSGETLDQFITNGFTEDLTTLLAKIPEVFVISRNTAFSYQGQRKDLREIGRELGVRYLLEGSLRRVDNHLRVTAQLIEADTGSHLWADKYDTPIDELPKVQDALIGGIALRLGTEIARAEFQLTQRQHPSDMNAWALYQSAKGSLMFMGWSKDSVKQAVDQLHQAIELDPDYAAPQAYLSLLLALAHWIKLVDDLPAAHDESVAAANRALELDPNSSEVLGYAGCAYSDLGYRQRGIPILQKAIDLDASNAQAKAALGAALIVSGELESGIAALTEAIKISPKDPGLAMWATILALGSGYTGDIEGAEKWSVLAYSADPRFFPTLVVRAWLQGKRGQLQDAQASLTEATRLNPELDADYIAGFLGKEIVRQMQAVGLNLPEAVSELETN
jgi:adenylate cyclase